MKIRCIKTYKYGKFDIRKGRLYDYTFDNDGDIYIETKQSYQEFLFNDSPFIRYPHSKSVPRAIEYFDNEQLMLIRLRRK